MKKLLFVVICVCFFAASLTGVVRAQDLGEDAIGEATNINNTMNTFYNDLADIIESNMNSPDKCVSEVEAYYQANQDKVAQVSQATSATMKALGPKMDKYMATAEQEASDLVKQGQVKAGDAGMSAEAARYTNALDAFTKKYPEQGKKIAAKTAAFVPGIDQRLKTQGSEGAQESQDQPDNAQ